MEDNYFTILWWFLPSTSTWIGHGHRYVPPSWTLLPPPYPPCPSGLSQITGFGCPASCMELALLIYSTYGNVLVLMLFSQIIPLLPPPTESKSLLFTSVSPLLPYMWDRHYRLSKFHIYVLIYSICLSVSDLLYSSW